MGTFKKKHFNIWQLFCFCFCFFNYESFSNEEFSFRPVSNSFLLYPSFIIIIINCDSSKKCITKLNITCLLKEFIFVLRHWKRQRNILAGFRCSKSSLICNRLNPRDMIHLEQEINTLMIRNIRILDLFNYAIHVQTPYKIFSTKLRFFACFLDRAILVIAISDITL